MKLINFYLQTRHQCVKLDGVLSESLPVTSGVPRGSVMAPLFFLIFIDDMIDTKYQQFSATLLTQNCSAMSTSA